MERALQRYAELRRSWLGDREHRRRSFLARQPRVDSQEQEQHQQQPYALAQARIDRVATALHRFLSSNDADLYLMASMIFFTVFWCFHVLGMGFFVTASSAVAMATLGYKYVETDGEQPADSSMLNTLQLRRRTKACLKMLANEIRHFSAELTANFNDELFVPVFVCCLIGIPVSVWLLTYFDEKTACAISLSGLAAALYYSAWRRQLEDYIASREIDSEMDEFLPNVDNFNFRVLDQACETGELASTPTLDDSPPDNSEDELLSSVEMMPSHDDCNTSSTDFELSELEMNAESSEVDGIRFKNVHFKQMSSSSSSSSDSLVADELDAGMSVSDDDTLCDFEVIDRSELVDVSDV